RVGQVERFGAELQLVARLARSDYGVLLDRHVQLRRRRILHIAGEARRKLAVDAVGREVGVAPRIVVEPVVRSLAGGLPAYGIGVVGVIAAEVDRVRQADGTARDVAQDVIGAPAAEQLVADAGDAAGEPAALAERKVPDAAERHLLRLVGGC